MAPTAGQALPAQSSDSSRQDFLNQDLPGEHDGLELAPTAGQALPAQSFYTSNKMHFKDGHPPGLDSEHIH